LEPTLDRSVSRPLLILIGLVVGWACSPWVGRPCLNSDEVATQFIRRGWHEATDPRGSWKTRICATESVITRYHGDDGPSAPACTEEILDHLETDFHASSPVANNRLQLARIVGISNASQTSEHMAAKADALLRLASLRDDDIANYQLTPGERGPALSKQTFRRLALRGLANGHLALNEDRVRQALLERRRKPRDAVERQILMGVTFLHFEDTLWGHPNRAVDNGSFALFDQILAETEAALTRPYDEVEHGLILAHLRLLAFHAGRFGRKLPLSKLTRHILSAEARVESVRGRPAARRDLYVAAALATLEATFEPRDQVRSSFEPWYEEAPRGRVVLELEPALYERGFDCRGKSAADLSLPALLERLDQGRLATGAEPSDELAKLLNLLPERPREVIQRPTLRSLLLTHPHELQERARSGWYENDPLRPLQFALAAPEPDSELARKFLRQIVATVRERRDTIAYSRELMLAARYARVFGIQRELSELAKVLAADAPTRRSSYDAVAAAGIRASLSATAFDPW
jgi:hypothetical protein